MNLHESARIDADEQLHIAEQRAQRTWVVALEAMKREVVPVEHIAHRARPLVDPVDLGEQGADAHDAEWCPTRTARTARSTETG